MKKILLLGTMMAALAFAAPARAHGLFSLHIGVPGVSVNIGVPPPPLIVHRAPICVPRPVIYAPPRVCLPPPPVVVVPSRRVVLAPAPVVVYRPHPRYVIYR